MSDVPRLDRRRVLRLGLLAMGTACTTSAPVAEPSRPDGTDPASRPPSREPTSSPTPAEPTAPPARSVDLLCRDAWSARPAASGMTAHTIDRITIHHSALVARDPSRGPARMREYQAFHMGERGWSDVAYHLGIDLGGHLYTLRRWDRAGATATEYDPTGHFLVLVDGHFDQQEPTEVQLERLADVLAWASAHFDVGLDTVTGHRDHAVTPCPGDAVYDRLPRLVDTARQRRDTGGVDLVERCGDAGRQLVTSIEAGA